VVSVEFFDGALRVGNGTARLEILVKPGSRKQGLTGFDPWRKRFIVFVSAQPQKGKANLEVVDVLQEALGINDITIVSGHTGTNKTVEFPMVNMEGVVAILEDVEKQGS
jgi:uncharacterized protein (TIGR00251 family)